MSSVPPTPTASCYICLENGTENGTLLRNCACRGDAGWVHVTCLAKYAASKVVDARKKDPKCPVLKYWNTCLLCKTNFMQNMGLAMASACVQQYDHLQETAELRHLSVRFMACITFDSGDYDGALRLYNRLVEVCEEKTREGFDMRWHKARYLCQIGQVFMRKNRRKDARATLEKELEIQIELHGPNSSMVRQRKHFLELQKKVMGGGSIQKSDTAEVLAMVRQQFKDDRKASSDKKDGRTKILCYMKLITALNVDGKYQEAMEQYENMVSESRRVLGPDHPDTLEYEDKAENHRMEMKPGGLFYQSVAEVVVATTSQMEFVWAVVDCDQKPSMSGKRVKVVRAAKDAGKYICQIGNHEGVLTKFKALHNQLIFEKGTKVVLVHGLISSTDLNGSIGIICSFNKEKQRYVVMTRNESTVLIKSINLNIVFFV